MAQKQLVQAHLVLKKTTPGALRYENDAASPGAITTLYLRKGGMPSSPPGDITVTVTADVEE